MSVASVNVTIKDVAKRAGVSPSTVSRVIADHPRISPETKEKVRAIMSELGYYPNAIARSLVTRPAVILADEPTGNLDRKNTEEITSLFRLVNQRFQTTLVLITHDEKVALSCDRVLTMVDGALHERRAS